MNVTDLVVLQLEHSEFIQRLDALWDRPDVIALE
jgi:hypothetical protein